MFEFGEAVGLAEVLAARERRLAYQTACLQAFPQQTLINYKCNIPGPIKNNLAIQALFEQGLAAIQTLLARQHCPIEDQKVINEKSGLEAFVRLDMPPQTVKTWMLSLEEANPIGRLYDIDVLYWQPAAPQGQQVVSLSRADLGMPARTCFMCDAPAKVCGRNRTHTVADMQAYITSLVSGLG